MNKRWTRFSNCCSTTMVETVLAWIQMLEIWVCTFLYKDYKHINQNSGSFPSWFCVLQRLSIFHRCAVKKSSYRLYHVLSQPSTHRRREFHSFCSPGKSYTCETTVFWNQPSGSFLLLSLYCKVVRFPSSISTRMGIREIVRRLISWND